METSTMGAGAEPARVFFWIFGLGGTEGSYARRVKRSRKIVQDTLLWLRFLLDLNSHDTGKIENKWAKCTISFSEITVSSSGAVSIGLMGNTHSVEMDFDFLRDRIEGLHHIVSPEEYLAVKIIEDSIEWNHFSNLYYENGNIESSHYRKQIRSQDYIGAVGVDIYLNTFEAEVASLRRSGMPADKILSLPVCRALIDAGVDPLETKWRRYLLADQSPEGEATKQKTESRRAS